MENLGAFPGRGRNIFLLPLIRNGPDAHSVFHPMGTQDKFVESLADSSLEIA